MEYLEKAATQDHQKAQYDLGNRYADGNQISKNIEKAVYWLEKGAHNYYVKIYDIFWLAERYADGKGIPKNSERALYWFELFLNHRSVNDGYHYLYQLSERYADGKGIPIDTEKALLLMEKAAVKDIDAQYKFGKRYAEGKGIPKDLEKAMYWIQKAAENNHKDAISWLKWRKIKFWQ